MSATATVSALRPSTLVDTLARLIPVKQPVNISGAPGIGKSDCVRQAVDRLNADLPAPKKGKIDDRWQLNDFRAALRDPVDLLGVPMIVNGRSRFAPPDGLPVGGRGVLFLDELDKAVPQV